VVSGSVAGCYFYFYPRECKQNHRRRYGNASVFVGVKLAQGGQLYHYLYDGKDIDVGDKIVIPVGEDCHDKVVEAVTVQRHRKATATCPLSRIKKVKRKYTEET